MNTTLHARTTTARRIAAACGVGVLLVSSATACGSASDDNGTTSTASSGPQTTQNDGNGGTGPFPGANGKIAEVDGSTAQVQSQQNGQVAVTWNASTTFTQEVAATASDIKVGDCVMATPDPSSTSSSSSDDTGDDTADDTPVAAAHVRILSTGGDCTAGLGGPGAGPGPSFNGAPPSGAPSGFPSGGPSGAPGGRQLRGLFGAAGKVTAVSGSGFTVDSVRPNFNSSGSSGDTTTASVTVTTTSSTTYTTNAKASASDVKVGRCLSAQGTTDDTGAVTAKTIALSAAVDGECTGGFTRFRGGPGSSTGTTGQAS